MAFQLEPITIAAIASGSLALLVVLVYYIARCRRRSRSRGLPNTPFTIDAPRSSFAATSYPRNRHSQSQSHSQRAPHPDPMTPPPSSGDSTLVGTPVSKLRKTFVERGGGEVPRRSPLTASPLSPTQVRIVGAQGRGRIRDRPETSDMVMVTYEEGLERLGLTGGNRPHHILYPDPPAFDELSPRPSPGRAGRVSGGRRGGAGRAGRRARGAGAGGRGGRGEGYGDGDGEEVWRGDRARGPSIPGLQSSWLPSYYHTSRREADEESELEYRSRWAGNRI